MGLVKTNDNCIGCNKCIRAWEPIKKDALNKQFADLNLNDFLRKYTDRSKKCAYKIPNDIELERIFDSLKKDTKEKRSEIVSRINGRTDNLVESSDRIAESVRLVKDMADNVEDSLKQILEE